MAGEGNPCHLRSRRGARVPLADLAGPSMSINLQYPDFSQYIGQKMRQGLAILRQPGQHAILIASLAGGVVLLLLTIFPGRVH